MEKHVIFIFLSLYILSWSESLNILVVFSTAGKRQFFGFAELFKALAQKGHNVTVISQFSIKTRIPNYRTIKIEKKEDVSLNLTDVDDRGIGQYILPLILAEIGQPCCERGFESKAVQNFLQEDNHFDLAIVAHSTLTAF